MGWIDLICSVHGLNVKFDEPLSKHSSMGVGGPAEAFIEPLSEGAAAELLHGLASRSVPRMVLGAGTNVIFSDSGFAGAVICPGSAFSGVRTAPAGSGAQAVLTVGAGTKLAALLRFARQEGLSGIERLAGIPGTAGGAVAMNAGAFGGTISNCVLAVRGLDGTGRPVEMNRSLLRFGYRSSNIPEGMVITEVVLRLARAPRDKVAAAIEKSLSRRRASQPLRGRSAGCIFRNPPGGEAGKLIDGAGLKRRRVGGAYVSHKHANFILNDGSAKASDVLALIEKVREEVEELTGVRLELEVKVVGGRE